MHTAPCMCSCTGTQHSLPIPGTPSTLRRCLQVYKLVNGCVERGMKRVRLHLLTDGRDVADGSSVKFIGEVQEFLKGLGDGVDGAIASGGGRMQVTMDRYEVRLLPRAAVGHGLLPRAALLRAAALHGIPGGVGCIA